MTKFIISSIFIAIISAAATWIFSEIKLKDSINVINYSANGTDLINSQDKLTNSLKIQANDKPVEKLTIYNIRFSNNSKKHIEKLKIEFKVKNSSNGELIASAIKGPLNYSDSLIHKISESKDSAIYEIDFLNVSKDNATDYFTASFLFSNSAPDLVTPNSLNSGIGFEDTRNNKTTFIFAATVAIIYVATLSLLLWWISAQSDKSTRVKQKKFEEALKLYITQELSLQETTANQKVNDISNLRDSIFKPKNQLKRFLQDWLSKE